MSRVTLTNFNAQQQQPHVCDIGVRILQGMHSINPPASVNLCGSSTHKHALHRHPTQTSHTHACTPTKHRTCACACATALRTSLSLGAPLSPAMLLCVVAAAAAVVASAAACSAASSLSARPAISRSFAATCRSFKCVKRCRQVGCHVGRCEGSRGKYQIDNSRAVSTQPLSEREGVHTSPKHCYTTLPHIPHLHTHL